MGTIVENLPTRLLRRGRHRTPARPPPRRRSSASSTSSSSYARSNSARPISTSNRSRTASRCCYSIDGVLPEVESLPAASTAAVISRIKILAKLNIAERRLAAGRPHHAASRARSLICVCRPCRRVSASRSSCVSSIASRSCSTLQARFHRRVPAAVHEGAGTAARHPARDRSDRFGQDDDAVYRAVEAQHARRQDHHGRRSGFLEYQIEGINQIQAKPQIGLDFSARAALDRAVIPTSS